MPLATAATLAAAEFPDAGISNGIVHARLYLPDVERGSYRGTRFDWSGVIYSLEFQGHQYFGRWYERHDPKIHDAITGPVEEFLTNDAGLGYDTAPPGGTFIRIGVGTVRKPAGESKYRRFETYDIVDPGKRTITKNADSIEFVHELHGENGHAYVYRKTVRLAKGKPQLILEHTLKNTGRRPLETSVYNHDFFVIDNEVVGPDVVIGFPFAPKPLADLKGLAEIRGQELLYPGSFRKVKAFSPNCKATATPPAIFDSASRIANPEQVSASRATSRSRSLSSGPSAPWRAPSPIYK